MRATLRSTSTRTFIAIPLLAAAEQLARRRPAHPAWLPVLAWGYAQYRLTGRYRRRLGGGPPGMSQGRPDRLVTTGPYARSRNPMYLGHLIFLAGLAALTRSPVALAALAATVPWFDARVRRDEARLAELFGTEYLDYRERVPRWIGSPAARVAPGATALTARGFHGRCQAGRSTREAGRSRRQ